MTKRAKYVTRLAGELAPGDMVRTMFGDQEVASVGPYIGDPMASPASRLRAVGTDLHTIHFTDGSVMTVRRWGVDVRA